MNIQKSKCRVLVVEDEPAISILIEDMLLDFGTEIVGPASRIEEALRRARGYSADAVPDRFRQRPTLRKPFTFKTFEETLREALAGRPCHREASPA
jgi:hypothetical protein